MPHHHCAPVGSDSLQGKVGVMGVFRVEISFISSMKWMEERGEVRRVHHWF